MVTVLFYPALCIVGGAGYCFLEMLWRGYTHWSMAIAGALSLLFMGFLCLNFEGMPIAGKAFLSAMFITAIELIFGIVFNLYFKMDVWDYSNQRLNFAGQICPLYSLLWFVISFSVIFVLQKLIYRF